MRVLEIGLLAWRLSTLEVLIGTVILSSETLYQFVLLPDFIFIYIYIFPSSVIDQMWHDVIALICISLIINNISTFCLLFSSHLFFLLCELPVRILDPFLY